MKTLNETITVDDTVENLQTCNCRSCPTYKAGKLSESPPNALFCARGKTAGPSKVKTINCYCPACGVFTKHKLIVGYFCAR